MTANAFYLEDSLPSLKPREVLDVTIVFGQGPIKPLLLEEELTSDQEVAWHTYKLNPLTKAEPDFFVIEREMPSDIFDPAQRKYWERLQTIRHDPELTDSQRTDKLKQMLIQWQHWGRFSLKSLGKQNAIAAGIALLTGMTKQVILTGGVTLPLWKEDEFRHLFLLQSPHPDELVTAQREKQFQFFLKYFIRWPSEAELMADMIMHNFDEAYEQKWGKSIKEVLHLEDDSKNTLENITFTLNKFSTLCEKGKRVGFLSTDYHLERVALIAHRFNLVESPNARISAQKLLEGTASRQEKEELKRLFEFYMSDINPWVKKKIEGEKRLISGLSMPEYLTYWFGYTFELEDPKIVSDVLQAYAHNPVWREQIQEAFVKAGLDFQTVTAMDLKVLKEKNEVAYYTLQEQMSHLTEKGMRRIPTISP